MPSVGCLRCAAEAPVEAECALRLWLTLAIRFSFSASEKAINVADSKIMFLHNWKSMQVAYATYIDPLCPATPACYRFFGWLLPPARADLPASLQSVSAVFAL